MLREFTGRNSAEDPTGIAASEKALRDALAPLQPVARTVFAGQAGP